MPLSPIPFRKLIGFLSALAFHILLIFLLLKDRVISPTEHVGQSVVTKIISESRAPEQVDTAPLKLQAPPLFSIEPPRLDMPLGKPVPLQPMVVIEAKFTPEVSLTIPASQYPPNLKVPVDVYKAQVSAQIFEDGMVGDVYVEVSDGNTFIDNYITSYAKSHWHFLPALSDGVPSLSWKSVRLEVTAASITVKD